MEFPLSYIFQMGIYAKTCALSRRQQERKEESESG